MADRSREMTQTNRDNLVLHVGWRLSVRLTIPFPKKILLRNLKEKYRGDQGIADVDVDNNNIIIL
jgi:hypothetical protein